MAAYCMLGEILFEPMTSFSSDQETATIDYAEHALIEGKPDLQFIGLGLLTRDVSMRFHAAFCLPEAQLAKLKAAAQNRVVMPLVMCHGNQYADQGDFIVTELTRNTIATDPIGRVICMEVSVKLKEYVDTRSFDIARPGVKVN